MIKMKLMIKISGLFKCWIFDSFKKINFTDRNNFNEKKKVAINNFFFFFKTIKR